jgi:hypothetical protein
VPHLKIPRTDSPSGAPVKHQSSQISKASIMAKTLEKTRKQIAKKRNGTIDALHQKSRDSKRLHRAQVRDERLEKIAEARRKKDQPLRVYPVFAQQYLRYTLGNKWLTVTSCTCRLFPGRCPGEWGQASLTRGYPGKN